MGAVRLAGLLGLLGLLGAGPARGAERAAEAADPPAERPPSVERSVAAGESDSDAPARSFKSWNHYVGPITSIQAGGGVLLDASGFAQDEKSESQVHAPDKFKLRDFRFLLKGKFNLERDVTWSAGIMWDAPTQAWVMRQTGIMVAVPEVWSRFFVGRTKEGFSMSKVMVGYNGWAIERTPINDATLPILADGIKWLGAVPGNRFLWNLGAYDDALSHNQAFSTYHNQVAARLIGLPLLPESNNGALLHVAVMARYGTVKDGQLQLRSRPESFEAPYFLDTGKFPAHHTRMLGGEAYYRPGPWLFGSEYWFVDVASPQKGDPVVHGGEVFASWLVTGETRAYNAAGGYFEGIKPAKSVFHGGRGAVELVLRQTYTDMDSAGLQGGKFWRTTPVVNWYLDERVRLAAEYGYGVLDRFGVRGTTQFFQARLQMWL
jgi:phosphate-selective porin OprO/OprP